MLIQIIRLITLTILMGMILVTPFIAQLSSPQPVHAASDLVQTIIGGGDAWAAGAATRYYSLQGRSDENATELNMGTFFTTAGTLSNFYVRTSTAVTSHTYTLMIGGAATAMAVTLTGATSGSYTASSISASSYVTLRVVSTDAAATPYIYWTVDFTPTGSTTKSIIMGNSTCVSAGTRYTGLYGTYATADATEANRSQVMPTAGTISRLQVFITAAPGAAGDAYTFTLYKNGVATALTCTITHPDTTGSDLVNSVSVVAGDLVSMQIVPVNVPLNSPICGFGTTFTATVPYESVVMSMYTDALNAAANEYNNAGLGCFNTSWTATEANVRQIAGHFTAKKLYISLSAAPDNGAGTQSYTLALRNTGTTTALSVTISELNTTGNNTTSTVDCSRGELITMISVPVGTPTTPFARWSFVTYYDPDAVVAPTWDQCVQKDYFTTGGDTGGTTVYGATYAAQTFTTQYAYTICFVQISLQRTGTPGTLTLALKATDGTGNPTGDDLATDTFNGDTLGTAAYTWAAFELLTSSGEQLSLEKGQKYALVLRALNGSGANYVQWYADTAAGYAYGNASRSTDGGSTWDAFVMAGYDYLFEFWGKASLAIIDAKVVESYKSTGDWLIVIHYYNKTAPHYPIDDVTTYFSLQFLTDTTTVIAQVPCQQWGERPGSIYLSASSVIPLNPQDVNYNVKIVANYDASVYATYVLLSADWLGQDLDRLDAYCLDIAKSIENNAVTGSAEASLTTYIANRGTVLNNTGAVYFNKGIPGLMAIRPNIFATVTNTTTNAGKKGITFAPSWQETLGPYITQVFTEAGDVAGVDAKDIGFILLMICYMLILIAFGTGHMAISVIISAPFIILAIWLGLFGAAMIAVGISILAFLMLRQLFMSR